MESSDTVLSSKIPVAYIDMRVLAHATEDVDKVLTAARSILPPEQVDSVVFSRSSLTGYHGNPIVLIETRIRDRRLAQAVLERLASGLNMMDKEFLSSKIPQHLEKGNLYLRLDKQAAFQGVFRFSSSDPIHLKVHFKKHTTEEITETCRNLGLLS
jgi:RNA binding exosome subunit